MSKVGTPYCTLGFRNIRSSLGSIWTSALCYLPPRLRLPFLQRESEAYNGAGCLEGGSHERALFRDGRCRACMQLKGLKNRQS